MNETNKSKYLHGRLTAPEWRAFVNMARLEGRKHSEMLRELICEGAAKRGCWPPAEDQMRKAA